MSDAEPADDVKVSRASSSSCGVVRQMFDFSLLLSPSYFVLCVSAVLPFIGTALIYIRGPLSGVGPTRKP